MTSVELIDAGVQKTQALVNSVHVMIIHDYRHTSSEHLQQDANSPGVVQSVERSEVISKGTLKKSDRISDAESWP